MIIALVLISFMAQGQIDFNQLQQHTYQLDTIEGVATFDRPLTGYVYKEGLRKNFKILGNQQGLNLSLVNAMHEDRFGRIWMGGAEGELCVFDGRVFSHFRIPGLSTNIYDIEEDEEGLIWFTTNGSGLYAHDGRNFFLVKFPDEEIDPNNLFAWNMAIDGDGRLLVGTHRHGLIAIQSGEYCRADTSSGLPDMSVTTVMSDSQNRLWLGHYSRGVTLVEFGQIRAFQHPDILPTNRVYAICEYDSTTTAIGTSNGFVLINYQFGKASSENFLSSHIISEMSLDNQDRLWIGINNRHGCYVYQHGRWSQYTEDEGLSANRVLSLLIDSEENVWLGTFGKGVCKHDPDVFENFNSSSGLLDNRVWALLPYDNGLLVGTHGGLSYIENDSIAPLNLIPELATDEVYDLYQDRSGKIWISTQSHGIYRISQEGDVARYPYPRSRKTHWVFDILESEDGEMFFAGYSGLMILDADSLRHVMIDGKPLETSLWCIRQAENGTFWMGSHDESLFSMDVRLSGGISDFKELQQFAQNVGIEVGQSGIEVMDILLDEDIIWFTVKRGGVYTTPIPNLVASLDSAVPSSITLIDMSTGLPTHDVTSLVKDRQGKLWVGTGNGVCSITEKSGKYQIRTYGSPFGLIDTEIIFNNALEDKNGMIWWCSQTFLSRYHPNRDQFDMTPPKLFMNKLKLYNTDIDWANKDSSGCAQEPAYLQSLFREYTYYKDVDPWTHLPIDPVFSFDKNNLSFFYSATNWDRESDIMYQLKLIGQDENWNPITKNIGKDYLNLDAGEYTLMIKARNADGIWSDPLSYSFTIMPPIWKTSWFIISMLCVLVIIVLLLVRMRIKRFKKENIVLENRVLQRTEQLEKEKKKSDDLLLNILPAVTAFELKERGVAKTRKFSSASVLFSDFEGFTKLTQTMDSPTLVKNLDLFFRAYDDASQKYEIEKIKTIGDAYMCAGGIPTENKEHPVQLVAFGLEMLAITKSINRDLNLEGHNIWSIRVGIHTGPVITGVVGKKKFSFDIWGDTVNTAARMEQNSSTGKINISQQTSDLVSEFFTIESRGKISAKGKGQLAMYFVTGFSTAYSLNGDTSTPNQKFIDRFVKIL